MEFINTGSTRLVFLMGKYAIKVPRCCVKPDNSFYGKVVGLLEGWKSNRYEYIWSKSNTYDFLCNVKYSFLFSFIIIMDRAKPITRKQFFDLEKFNFGGYEHKQDSIGIINGDIKIIDYG